MRRVLDWADSRGDWTFLGILYVARWVIIGFVWPLQAYLVNAFATDQQAQLEAYADQMKHPAVLVAMVFMLLIVAPVFETLLECALPYWVIGKFRTLSERPWGFVIVSALAMTVLHPLMAAPCTFVTGAFLAYCYAHYATRSRLRAILFATLFHAGINVVGSVALVLSVH